jgi:hypothetical protein
VISLYNGSDIKKLIPDEKKTTLCTQRDSVKLISISDIIVVGISDGITGTVVLVAPCLDAA